MDTRYHTPNENFVIKGNWALQSIKLKEMFSQLSNEDLLFEYGKDDELMNRIETKLNKSKDEVIILLQKLFRKIY